VKLVIQPPVETGDTLADLKTFLQHAIQLEHATIPPYLTAMYSLVPGTNELARALVRSVVVEEMSHMALAANVLSAVGGTPRFTAADFIPTYPGGLPYKIGDEPGQPPFAVHLAPFSLEVVQNTFMVIELPETPPLDFPVTALKAAVEPDETFKTIGAFYQRIRELVIAAGPDVYSGDPGRQLTHPQGTFAIRSQSDAIRAVDQIVRQGEGTSTLPTGEAGGEIAHYYRFAEIVKGRLLVPDPMQELGYSYSGAPVAFDDKGVIPIVTDPKQDTYLDGSEAARISRQFNGLYGNLLRMLEESYTGKDVVANVIGIMFDMKIIAQRLMSVPVPQISQIAGAGRYAAPTFEYALTRAAL
jgi:hypothetical protein